MTLSYIAAAETANVAIDMAAQIANRNGSPVAILEGTTYYYLVEDPDEFDSSSLPVFAVVDPDEVA